jgi:opacity protein-like surface antigen
MNWTVMSGLMLLAMVLGGSSVRAEDDWPGRIYLEARGGLSDPPKVSLTDIKVAGTDVSFAELNSAGSLEYKIGWTAGLAAGYQLNDYFRVEIDASYRKSNLDKLNFREQLDVPLRGSAQMIAGMVNGYFDIRQSPEQPVVPFIGVGVGAGYLDIAESTLNGYQSKGAEFVWNAGFGVMWAITRHIGITVAYRFVGTTDIDLTSPDPTIPRLTLSYGAHESYMGLRFTF